MIDERCIMVDHHIYISLEKNVFRDNIVSLVDIIYPRGFGKVLFRKLFFEEILVNSIQLSKLRTSQVQYSIIEYLAGTLPFSKLSFDKTLTQ